MLRVLFISEHLSKTLLFQARFVGVELSIYEVLIGETLVEGDFGHVTRT